MPTSRPVRPVRLRAGLAAALVAAALSGGCGPSGPELHVFVWADYVPEEVYDLFHQETGVRVVESTFTTNEELRAKLQAGATGYDLVCPSDYAVALLAKDGLLEELDPARLTNLGNLDERFRAPPYDPTHRWSVPFQWGVTGIGYDTARVDPPPTGWGDLFDPVRAQRFAGRVSMLDDVRELVGAALIHLGHSPNERDPAALGRAEALLLAQKPLVQAYDSEGFGDAVAVGAVDVAQGWNGTFAQARADRPSLAFVVPEEGTLVYVDNWAVPRGAPNKELAERFVDFLLRADVAARVVNRQRYASCNAAARAHIDPEVLAGMSYDQGTGQKLWWLEDVGEAAAVHERIRQRLKGE
jgi:spermidine/putrescine transport system substrate-binding protein